MNAPVDDFTPGEVGRSLVRIEGDVREVKSDIKGMAAIYVTRAEYDVREQSVDREIKGIRDTIATGFAEVKAQRAPWWVIGTLGFGGVSSLVSLIALYKG